MPSSLHYGSGITHDPHTLVICTLITERGKPAELATILVHNTTDGYFAQQVKDPLESLFANGLLGSTP